jgi:hypothetical protein
MAQFDLWASLDSSDLPSNWASSLSDAADAYYTAWTANADDSVFRTSVTLDSVKVAHMDSTIHTQHEGIHTPGSPWAGTGTGASLPWQVAFCVGVYSYTPGTFIPDARTRRGRCYLPPMTVAVLDIPTKGTVSDSRVLDTLTWFAQLISDVNTHVISGTTHAATAGVLSRRLHKAARPAPQLFSVTDVAADGVLDSQRRRTHQESRTRQSAGLP